MRIGFRRRAGPTVTFLFGVASVVAAGGLAWWQWPRPVDKGTVPAATAPPPATTPTTPTTTTGLRPLEAAGAHRQVRARPPGLTSPRRADPGLSRPVSLQIPFLKVTASVEPVSVGKNGALGVPADPHQLGWWSQGPPPGAPAGTAVIDGHVDWTGDGPGALYQLHTLPVGATIIVNEKDGPRRFRVAAIREYAKTDLPWKEVFSQHVQSRLVLVTCGGGFDYQTHHYYDNVVAYAVPAKT